ncbi:hypothetical protein IAT40_000660 [Kwoniella sp. CBS 6097]
MAPGKQKFRPPKPVQRPPQIDNQTQQAQAQTTTLTQSQSQPRTQTQSRLSQSQRQDLKIVNKQESLQVVRTVLEASLSTICFLRNLLPNKAFEWAHIATRDPPPNKSPHELYQLTPDEAADWKAHCEQDQEALQSQQIQSQLSSSQKQKRSKSVGDTFRYKKIEHGGSDSQADKLLGLVSGVMEGVTKGFIQSMAFVVGLDKNNPSNIVESYTFNFFYHPSGVPGLSLDHARGTEPGTQVLNDFSKTEILGAPMSHLDVRRAVKPWIKNLIKVCSDLEDLPSYRWVDVKVYYNASAPKDFVLPGFSDSHDTLTMGTHNVDDAPTKYLLNPFQTGHHGVSVTALTIADQLPLSHKAPESYDEDPEERVQRVGQNKFDQEQDAKRREIVWDADRPAHDRLAFEDGSADVYQLIDPNLAVTADASGTLPQPIGRRDSNGLITPIPAKRKGPSEETRSVKRAKSHRFSGRTIPEESLQLSQTIPATLTQQGVSLLQGEKDGSISKSCSLSGSHAGTGSGDNNAEQSLSSLGGIPEEEPFPGPQQDEDNPMDGTSAHGHFEKSNDNTTASSASDKYPQRQTSTSSLSSSRTAVGPSTTAGRMLSDQALVNNLAGVTLSKKTIRSPKTTSKPAAKKPTNPAPKTVKPRAKPKPKPKTANGDTPVKATPAKAKKQKEPRPKPKTKPKGKATKKPVQQQDTINCYCGVNDEDGPMLQCDGCEDWFHGICMGFFELNAKIRKTKFFCLPCEIKKDRQYKWTKDEVEKDMDTMTDLSSIRRAMGIIQQAGQLGDNAIQELQQGLCCSSTDAATLLRVIEDEGLTVNLAHINAATTVSSGGRQKLIKRWSTRLDQVSKFMDYFKPGGGIENEVLRFRQYRMKAAKKTNQRKDPPSSSYSSIRKQDQGKVSQPNDSQGGHHTDLEEQEGGEVSSYAIETNNGALNPSIAGPSQYALPPIRSARANALLDMHDYWTDEPINTPSIQSQSRSQHHSQTHSQHHSQNYSHNYSQNHSQSQSQSRSQSQGMEVDDVE